MGRGVFWVVIELLVGIVLSGAAGAAMYDLTSPGSQAVVNEALFWQYSVPAAVSGNIDSFVRIQGCGVQEGYNSDFRPGEFDEGDCAEFNHSILLSDVSVLTVDGTDYRQFLLDINQQGGGFISLDQIQIALHSTGDMTGYSTVFSSPIFDLDAGEDNWIMLDYSLNAGSGQEDVLALIPESLFSGPDEYVYFYSRFGENLASNAGFEEWAVGAAMVNPEPTTVLLLGLGSLFVFRGGSRR